MSANLGVDLEVNTARTTTSAVIFLRESISALDKALRWSRNQFGEAAKLFVGTAVGDVPVLDTNGMLPLSVIPKIPLSKITTGTFNASQIPTIYAEKIGSGKLPAARFNNLPATKIRFGKLTSLQLPAGWKRTSRPTSGRAGGPGLIERRVGGRKIGESSAFVGQGTSGTGNPKFSVQGRVSGSILEIQLIADYPGSTAGTTTNIADFERLPDNDDRDG